MLELAMLGLFDDEVRLEYAVRRFETCCGDWNWCLVTMYLALFLLVLLGLETMMLPSTFAPRIERLLGSPSELQSHRGDLVNYL